MGWSRVAGHLSMGSSFPRHSLSTSRRRVRWRISLEPLIEIPISTKIVKVTIAERVASRQVSFVHAFTRQACLSM